MSYASGSREIVQGIVIVNTVSQHGESSYISDILCKGKAIPLQASTGPEGSRRMRLTDFKTIGT
jgi:hypothetical protein